MEAKFRDIPDPLWEQIAPLIPVRQKKTLRGRPPAPNREVLAGIVYRLRTGCQWKALPVRVKIDVASRCHAAITSVGLRRSFRADPVKARERASSASLRPCG